MEICGVTAHCFYRDSSQVTPLTALMDCRLENDEIGLSFCNVSSNTGEVYCSRFKCFTEDCELLSAVRVVNITFRERSNPRNFRLRNILTEPFAIAPSASPSSSDVFNISINPSRDVFRTH